jgi:aconitate hydratase
VKAAKKTKRKTAKAKSPAKAKGAKKVVKAKKAAKAVKKPARKAVKAAKKKAVKVRKAVKAAKKAITRKVVKKAAKKAVPAVKKAATAKKASIGAARAVPIVVGQDTLKTRRTLKVGNKSYAYYSIKAAEKAGLGDLTRLPYSLKVLLENLLRYEDGRSVTVDDLKAVAQWLKDKRSDREIAYRPARVLMQDFTGVPAVVDLAAMRDAMTALGRDTSKINPLSPVDLVIDHSVMVDHSAAKSAFQKNVDLEYERNGERYAFLRWGQTAFDNFRVVPPGTGICHQVNVEYLAQTVWTGMDGKTEVAYPDTLVGTDSHTTMVNGLAVLGWGVGGIEAEAAMLGQPISMLLPEVVGFRLSGKPKEGTTATDLVLTVTQMLRKKGVVNKFVEFYGPGLDELSLADRCTIANMAPEYGATCGFFPVDEETIAYLKASGRDTDRVKLVEAYAKAQGFWRTAKSPDPIFTDTLDLDLSTVEPSLAGPTRPEGRVPLSRAAAEFKDAMTNFYGKKTAVDFRAKVENANFDLGHGDVVIAAITSCTNTSNPSVLLGAGLLARNAIKKGLTTKPWVKTSLAPGSQVVTDYLAKSGLQKDLDTLGFQVIGYGCTTCIGNSGPLPDNVSKAITDNDFVVGAVLSGNRNFEGRVHPLTKANYLASPMLVVAYALAGNLNMDVANEPLGYDKKNKPVYLKDIWPSNKEIATNVRKYVTPAMFKKRYADVFKGDPNWRKIKIDGGQTYGWDKKSTYVQHPPYFEGMSMTPAAITDVKGARVLAILGDKITTDHISPAGSIKKDGPAGKYLTDHGVTYADFNSYGARRGNHEVMMRGTFANIRLKNEMVPGTEGGITKHMPAGEVMSIYDAAMKYRASSTPLVIVAGKEYGNGSSRDWAAKGTILLGVKAVIAESYERIHRSNLVGMGVLPLQFLNGMTRFDLKLDGSEKFDISGIAVGLKPRMKTPVTITRADGSTQTIEVLCRIDTLDEIDYYKNGGILHYVLRNLARVA